MFKLRKLVPQVAFALAFGSAGLASAAIPAAPAALADAFLDTTGFTILKGFTGDANKSATAISFCITTQAAGDPFACAGGEELRISQLNASSQIGATMTGQTPGVFNHPTNTLPAQIVDHSYSTDGAYQIPSLPVNGSYTLFTPLPTDAAAKYSAAAAFAAGDSLDPGTGSFNVTHSQSSLNTYGFGQQGSGNSNLGLTNTLTFEVTSDIELEVNFNASAYLRAALGQLTQLAQASHNWSISLVSTDGGGVDISWVPNGIVGSVICDGATCTEWADGYDINNTLSAPASAVGSEAAASGGGAFDLEVLLPEGAYQLTLNHSTSTFVGINEVPEPAILGLLGIGLLGLGLGVRRQVRVV